MEFITNLLTLVNNYQFYMINAVHRDEISKLLVR